MYLSNYRQYITHYSVRYRLLYALIASALGLNKIISVRSEQSILRTSPIPSFHILSYTIQVMPSTVK